MIFSSDTSKFREKEMERLFTFSLVHFFVWFAIFLSCNCRMEWCDEKIELLINMSSQNSFLFGVKLSDYHSRIMGRAASRSSAITNFDAVNRPQFFHVRCSRHGKLAPESSIKYMAPINDAGFWRMCTRLNTTC